MMRDAVFVLGRLQVCHHFHFQQKNEFLVAVRAVTEETDRGFQRRDGRDRVTKFKEFPAALTVQFTATDVVGRRPCQLRIDCAQCQLTVKWLPGVFEDIADSRKFLRRRLAGSTRRGQRAGGCRGLRRHRVAEAGEHRSQPDNRKIAWQCSHSDHPRI